MSRVIKFRAWNGSEMVMPQEKSYYQRYISFCGNIIQKSSEGMACFGGTDRWRVESDLHVMQFTGLTDKNGVDIYEGDICIWYINDLERLGEVYYHDQSFEMRSPSMGYIGWDANRGEIEVIGNIYQNLELLK
jgi:uncharacterized phage protein (TIGR01671 family)